MQAASEIKGKHLSSPRITFVQVIKSTLQEVATEQNTFSLLVIEGAPRFIGWILTSITHKND